MSGRAFRLASRSARRVWKCGACRRQFSVLVGTVLQRTRIALDVWVAVIASDERTPALLTQRFGITPESARHLLHRLSVAEAALSATPSGPAVAPVSAPVSAPVVAPVAPSAPAVPAAPAVGPHWTAAAWARLGALLALPPEAAAAVRRGSPSRQRPQPQAGPRADYGD